MRSIGYSIVTLIEIRRLIFYSMYFIFKYSYNSAQGVLLNCFGEFGDNCEA